ncbi:ABC transporter substrate-binding protein [Paeniglutamicibacter sp. R2-26]|uniref:ABC transporter substrate-binding protein n=1 Tax=Paeniglutamicibacter sp. R2-26 TaxID=3144417 RepID=UPI003EE4551B
MKKHSVMMLSFTAAMALGLTACAGGASGAKGPQGGTDPSADRYAPVVVHSGFAKKGGNVNVLMSADFATLDPGNSNYVQTANVGQLYYRTLTMAKETAGQPPEIVPDLATDTGTVSDDGLTWTYTLRDGLKFEDGTPITSKDVKYGVERTYARDVYTQAPQELNSALVDDGYKGPYSGGDLKAIETPDDKTVVFHLKQAFAEFPALVSRSNTAPVPEAKDTKQDYTNHPVSSGPYKVKSYERGREMVLERNENWDPATDPNRPALPDTYTFSLSTSQSTISQKLIADADANAITLDSNGALQVSDAASLNDPKIKERTASGFLGCIDVLDLNTETITDPDVRKAIALAMDRESIQVQYGGARFGQLVTTQLTEKMAGVTEQLTDLDPAGKPKVEEAKKLLEGKDYPKKLVYGYSNATERYKNVGTVLQQNLKEIGIDLELRPIPAANYYSTLAGEGMTDIARSGWCGGADSSSVRMTVDPNLGPSLDGKTYGFSNIPRFYDETLSKKMYELRSATGTAEELGAKWSDLYNEVMATYPLVPTMHSYTNSVVGSNIRNAQVGYFFGAIDLNSVGVAE